MNGPQAVHGRTVPDPVDAAIPAPSEPKFGVHSYFQVEGRWMTQSGAILLYLSEQFESLRMTESECSEVVRWLLFDNHKFTANLASYRWLRTFVQQHRKKSK